MCVRLIYRYACNELNGVPPLASSFLNGKLESWGFDGYRTTDGGAPNLNFQNLSMKLINSRSPDRAIIVVYWLPMGRSNWANSFSASLEAHR